MIFLSPTAWFAALPAAMCSALVTDRAIHSSFFEDQENIQFLDENGFTL